MASELGGGIAVVNWAGRYLHGMRRWSSGLRATTTLDYAIGQAWLDLPADYGEGEYVAEGRYEFRVVERGELERWIASGGQKYVASYVNVAGAWRLYLGETPTASVADAVTFVYRRRWVDLASDNDLVDLPVWMEALLRRLVSAYARGLEGGMLDEELARVESSPVLATALKQDASGSGGVAYYVPGTGAADRSLPDHRYRDWVVTYP